jgi:two-component system, OmpR family, sensor histidine kinase BaeS
MKVRGFTGFGTKLFLFTAAVAVLAAGATALLTVRQVTEQVNESAAIAQRDVDMIVGRLAEAGALRAQWPDLAGTVAELARQTGQRIRLTSEQGELVVDSDTVGGGAARPVSDRAVLTVDPRPLPDYTGLAPVERFERTVSALEAYRSSHAAATCLLDDGVPVVPVKGPLGVPTLDEAWMADPVGRRCVKASLEPSQFPAGDQLFREYLTCDPHAAKKIGMAGMPERTPVTPVAGAATDVPCLRKAFRTVDTADTPPPLSLSLGVGNQTKIVPISLWPALLAAAAVALVAVAGTALVSRRVLRPVVRLTAAARRLGDGDLAGRVPVRGHDEIAKLATSFNRMATSLQASREQQRTMVADIAHELRTPLANIRGYLEALKDGVLTPDPALFLSLYEEAVLQQRLIDDLQELAQAEAGTMIYHRTRLDVAELLSTCRTAHTAAAQAGGVTLEVYVYQRPVVVGDADRLRQVLGNLVTNALRATPPGGSVRLRATATTEVTISVADTGHGIAQEDIPHVFDRFWRADHARSRSTGGSGLGLAIAKEIVAAHDGTITVESEVGAGTTFTIHLPLPDGTKNRSRSSGPATSGRSRV